GSSFSEALAKHPKTFDKLYVNMVKAGEAGGVLDVILQRLAGFMERMEALKRKIIGASIYPAVVITIAVAVVLAIMTFIVPMLEALAIVKNATGNEVVSNAIATVHDSIREGESIAEPLAACGVFDDIVINMIDVGEETGELDKMLLKVADNYDNEVDAAVSALMSVM